MFRLYTIFFDFVAVIFIATFHARDELAFRHAHPIYNIMQHIKSATNSRNEAYSDYLTTASYDELVAQIRNAEGSR